MIDAQFEIIERKLAVVPFSDPLNPVIAPRFTVDLSRAIARDIATNNLDDIEVMPPQQVEAFFRNRNIADMTPQQIGLALGVDFLIFGEILQYDPRGATIGMNQGHLRVRVRVQDIVNDDVPWEDDVYVRFPSSEIMGFDERQIVRGLVEKAGRVIGRRFYAHEPPEREKMELPK